MPAIANTTQSRQPRTSVQKIKDTFNAVSLVKYFDPFMDWMYGIALILAIFKDILDIISFGILGMFFTFFISFAIGMIMFITGSGAKKRMVQAILNRYGTLLAGSLFETLFLGLNIFPVTTFSVILIFYLTLRERMLADKEKKMAAASA